MVNNTKFSLDIDVDLEENPLLELSMRKSWCKFMEGWIYRLYKTAYPVNEEWFNYHNDMLKFSKLHPDILFTLKGADLDMDEFWIIYYKNGRFQRGIGELVYPEFNEDNLI